IWVHQFLKALRDGHGDPSHNAHIIGFLRRVCKLLFYNIKPIFVFDGPAPTLKRRTLNQRRELRARAMENHQRAAEKLLFSSLQLASSKRDDSTSRISETSPDDTNDSLKVRPHVPLGRANSGKRDRDEFELPDLARGVLTNVEADDPRFDFDTELHQYLKEYKPEMEVNLDAFDELPLATQYELIAELRGRSRQTSERRLKHMQRNAPKAYDFSQLQIQNLMQRNHLTQKYLDVVGIGDERNLPNATSARVASVKNRAFSLVKNPELGGGWKLTHAPTLPARPSTRPSGLVRQAAMGTARREVQPAGKAEDCEIKFEELFEGWAEDESSASSPEPYPSELSEPERLAKLPKAEPIVDTILDSSDECFEEVKPELLELERWRGYLVDGVDAEVPDADAFFQMALHGWPREMLLSKRAELVSRQVDPEHPDFDALVCYEEFLNLVLELRYPSDHETKPEGETKVDILGAGSPDSSPTLAHKPHLAELYPDATFSSQLPPSKTSVNEPTPMSEVEPATAPVSQFKTEPTIERNDRLVDAPVREPAFDGAEDSMPQLTEDSTQSIEFNADSTATLMEPELERVGQTLYQPVELTSHPVKQPVEVLAAQPTSELSEEPTASVEVEPAKEQSDQNLHTPMEQARQLINQPMEALAAQPTSELSEEPTASVEVEPAKEQSDQNLHTPMEQASQLTNRPMELLEAQPAKVRIGEPIALPATDVVSRESLEKEVAELTTLQASQKRIFADPAASHFNDIKELLTLFGVPYIDAEGEAEAQCAELTRLGLADGVVTDDSDVFLFGGSPVYRNLFRQSKMVEAYRLEEIERQLNLPRERLIQLAHLLGSDYAEGLAGVGPVTALEILAAFPEGLPQFAAWWRTLSHPAPWDEPPPLKKLRRQAKKLFLPSGFPSAIVTNAYLKPSVNSEKRPFSWGSPDLPGLRSFLRRHLSWSEKRVDEVIEPILRHQDRLDKATQTSISDFFTSGSRPPVKTSSKRLDAALQRLAATHETPLESVEISDDDLFG
ncbi:DNA repair protein rad2, partial [Massospora cicadina]